jgi:hypothetical protein
MVEKRHPLSEKEFILALEKVPGVRVDGDVIHGIRLATEAEVQERKDNTEVIRLIICDACRADDRSCSSRCTLIFNRAPEKIARIIPLGTHLNARPVKK